MKDSLFNESHSTITRSFSSDDEVSSNASSSMDRRGGTGADDESIDTLYKAMEMAEAIPPPEQLNREASSPPPPFIAVETTASGQRSPANVPVADEEDERAFVWVLLEFMRKRNWKKKLLTVVIICSSVYVITDVLFLGNIVPMVNNLMAWMTENTVLACITCILFFAAATLFFVPHAILIFAAGWAFSNVLGFGLGLTISLFVSFMGSALGAILSFLRSRYMMRDLVELFADRFPIVKATDRAIQRKGFKIFLLLRLCPIIPFNVLNYIGGITSVSLEEYTKAIVGILPMTLLWSTVGASADKITDRHTNDFGEQVFLIGMFIIGIVCGMAGLARVYKYARDELRKEIEYDRAVSWRKYKKSSSSTLENKPESSRSEPSPVDEGIEVLNRADLTLLAVLGIDGLAVEAQRPPEQQDDDDPFWYWA